MGQDPGDFPDAFARGTVVSVVGRKVAIDSPDVARGTATPMVAIAHTHRRIGILAARIGDFSTTELTLLDPLAKSIGQFCRLLLRDDEVNIVALRSMAELRRFWIEKQAVTTLAVITSHGRKNAIMFGVDGAVTAEKLVTDLEHDAPGPEPKLFISLACLTGHAEFARPFSKWHGCSALLAPFHSVHAAVASQFAQTFLVYHLLEGETPKVAFNHARKRVAGATSFRMWVRGDLTAGPR